MKSRDEERQFLINETSWRQPALPAGRIALVRGAVIFSILFCLYWMMVPLGPETGPTARLLASYWNPPETIAIPLAVQLILLKLSSFLISPEISAKVLSIFLTTGGLAILVCWLRQLDASRSTVVTATLLAGLSPGIAQIVIHGGSAPLIFFTGTLLLVTTDQMRAEAGRGLRSVSFFFGASLAFGPAMIPVQIYSLLTILFDQSNRDLIFRNLLRSILGVIFGFLPCFLTAIYFSESSSMASWIEVFVQWKETWESSISGLHFPSVELLFNSTHQVGVFLLLMALPGFLWSLLRRPGDACLMLLMMTSGAFALPTSTKVRGFTTVDAMDPYLLFASLPALVFCSWTLTIAHRRMARFQPSRKFLVSISSLIICFVAVFLVKPLPWKPTSQLVQQWAASVLESAPQDALLLTGGNASASALVSVQWRDGLRPDVIILDPWGIREKPWSSLEHQRLGLSSNLEDSELISGIQELLDAGRPLVALPEALSHPLMAGKNIQPRALLFEIRPEKSPLISDMKLMETLSMADLPSTPKAAWAWIRGEGDFPPRRGRLAGRVAARSWLALARSKGELTFTDEWSPILAVLEGMYFDPDAVQEWALGQPDLRLDSRKPK